MTGPEMFRGVKLICETFSDCNGFPEMDTKNKADVADMIEELLKAANRALDPLRLRIGLIQGDISKLCSHWSALFAYR